MADGGVATEVNISLPKAPREIRHVDPQRHAVEQMAAQRAREQAALVASGEDHAREEAERVRKELEAQVQAHSSPQFDQKPITLNNHVKIHPHPGEMPYDPSTGEPKRSGVVVEKEQKQQLLDEENKAA